MINNISWQGYWITIALLTGTYYLGIFLLYYRNDLKNLFSIRQVKRVSSAAAIETNEKGLHKPPIFSEEFSPGNVEGDRQEVIPIVQSLKDEVEAFFDDERQKEISKKDLLVSLRRMCNKYPTVLKSSYQHSVNQFIIFLAEQNCSIHLSAEEISDVWLR